MEASLAHKKAIAISFPFNGWGSWTDDDIATAVQVALQTLAVLQIMNIWQFFPLEKIAIFVKILC